jgi:transcriptional regulator with XRE-family HTH domain
MKQSASKPPTYGKLLKQERERLGLSQQALAEKVDATFVTISNWERGKTMPGPYHRRLLSNLFGKSLKELGLLPDEPEESSREQIVSPTPETHDTLTASATPAHIWNIPYARNLLFTGREDVLEYLHESFLSNGTVILTQPQAISGLGGIGKTQTAVEYAYRCRDHYHPVLWVKADSHELLVSDFVTIAGLLSLPEKNEEDQNHVVSAVKRWLESTSQWLLILDNADDLEMASEFIPTGGRGHIC